MPWIFVFPTLVPSLLFILAVYLFFTSYRHTKRHPLPPGPFKWPIVGNIFNTPRSKEWITFTSWRKIYGDVISITILGRSTIILNSAKAAIDLLNKQSSIYSDRPNLTMAGELVGWDHALGMSPYNSQRNSRVREMRRLIKGVLGPAVVGAFGELQERECIMFLGKLLNTPEKFLAHIRHATGAIVLNISYGYDISEEEDDPDILLKLAESTLSHFSDATAPGAFVVDSIPWLKHIPAILPGMGFLRKAALWRKTMIDMVEVPSQFTKTQMAQGPARLSFLSKLLEEECTPEKEEVYKWAAFSLYAGGADTTVSTASSFFLAMCTHPHVQHAAQAELDRVIGTERLPHLSDRTQLPYIDALIKELLRWAPTAPLGVPHRVTQEDVYEGYRIPAGSTVISNIWGFLHDPEVYPNPEEFRPERFFGKMESEVTNPTDLAFGFGRRICPGKYLAEEFLFACVAMTLATFSITKAHDEHRNVIEPEIEWTSGTISHPEPFKCSIKPRSKQAVGFIKQLIAEEKHEW